MEYITIDTGTTNSRIKYVKDGEILCGYRDKVGVRDTAISGGLDKLKTSIRKGINHCLKTCSRELGDVDKIIASGMITSNLGLIEIPHLEAPIELEDLALNVVIKKFDDIVDKPIYFIPGVKNKSEGNSIDDLCEIDMMRGEETEAMGAISLENIDSNLLFISPGSHTKFVFLDKDRRIERCSTTLTGELLWALSKETVLANSISSELISKIDKSYINKGIETAKKHGFSKTCFLVRIIDTFTEATSNQLANFITGAISYYDIFSIEEELFRKNPQILIGGSQILRELYGVVFELMGYDMKKVKLLSNDIVEKASTFGAIKIIENYKGKKGEDKA